MDVLEELDTGLQDGTHSFEGKLLVQLLIPLSNPIFTIIRRSRVEKTISQLSSSNSRLTISDISDSYNISHSAITGGYIQIESNINTITIN